MRVFDVYRKEDVSGVSGTGIVAQAVEFDDGTTILHWKTEYRSTAVYRNLEECIAIHGHDGRTEFMQVYVE